MPTTPPPNRREEIAQDVRNKQTWELLTILVEAQHTKEYNYAVVDELRNRSVLDWDDQKPEPERPFVRARLLIYEFTNQDDLDKQMGRSLNAGIRDNTNGKGNRIRVIDIPSDFLPDLEAQIAAAEDK